MPMSDEDNKKWHIDYFQDGAEYYNPDKKYVDEEDGTDTVAEHYDYCIWKWPDMWEQLNTQAALKIFIDRSPNEEQVKKATMKLWKLQ